MHEYGRDRTDGSESRGAPASGSEPRAGTSRLDLRAWHPGAAAGVAETTPGRFLLLDGFKRYRCAKQLKIEAVACVGIADEVAGGILRLIRTANDFSLHLIEQARLVTELHKKYRMTTQQIAAQLDRSPAWVSMRLGLLKEMSPTIQKEIFSGRFPARSFMYTLRQFTRVHKAPSEDVDKFVKAVSGKELSGRAVDQLAGAYFRGGENFREQILKGNFGWTLEQLEKMQQVRAADPAVMGQAEMTVTGQPSRARNSPA